MVRILVTGFLSGALAVPVFHEGTAFVLFHNFVALQGLFGLDIGFRPLSAGFSMRLAPPLGMPELFNLIFWGGCWGVGLMAVLRLLRTPELLTGFLFGALVCTGIGFAPWYGERGLPFWSVLYLPNWARMALINGAWGWGAAGLMMAGGLMPVRRRR